MRSEELRAVRLANLRLLRRKYTLVEIAQKTGTNSDYLSQIENEVIQSKGKTPRKMSDNYAEKIEHGLGLPHRWMDQPHGDDESAATTAAPLALPPLTAPVMGEAASLTQGEFDWLDLYHQLPEAQREALAAAGRELAKQQKKDTDR